MKKYFVNRRFNPKGLKRNEYDVIIIGSGIGGLISGCYLIKEGLKVLIIEQNYKPGGCCTSFKSQGYKFDIGVHYLGSLRRGILGKILGELELKNKMMFTQFDPVEKIIMPERIIYIRADYQNTIEEFKKKFYKERVNIEKFFELVLKKDFFSSVYPKIKKLTFKEILDTYFIDKRLKAVFNAISLWNIGAEANVALALCGIALLREYLLDSGCYPLEGIGSFPNTLAEFFKKKGGQIFFSKRVVKIITENIEVKGVTLDNGERLYSKVVVSNSDASKTFNELLDVRTRESEIVDKLIVSPSMFAVYLGLKVNIKEITNDTANILYFSYYDLGKIKYDVKKIIGDNNLDYLICAFTSSHDKSQEESKRSTVSFFIHASYESDDFWKKNKNTLSEIVIKKGNQLIPNLSNYIDTKRIATPLTFHKYTLNRRGSYTGWIHTLNQNKLYRLYQRSSIKGLYCAGHWYTGEFLPQGGVPVVSFSGRRASRLVLGDLGLKWRYKEITL